MTTVQLRPLAEADLTARARYYRREGGGQLGEQCFDAAVEALGTIGRMPGAGSPRIGELCGVPGLRVRCVIGFPCCWFYFVSGDRVDAVRLLADAQDLPTILADVTNE